MGENEELRGKLLKFTETYEAQEKQLAEQREARGREMEVAQQRLKEHESMFHEAVTGSNQRHGECKVEIDSLQSRLQDLEKENVDLRNSPELSKLTQDQDKA